MREREKNKNKSFTEKSRTVFFKIPSWYFISDLFFYIDDGKARPVYDNSSQLASYEYYKLNKLINS